MTPKQEKLPLTYSINSKLRLRLKLSIRIAIIFAIIFFFTKVNLSPQISTDYFFSALDPVYQEYQKISNIFPPKESIILVVKSPTYSIQSNQYYRQIAKLTNKILTLKGVVSVFSLSRGPENPTEANENLVWKEIIFGESNSATSSTLITSSINKKNNPNIVKDFEKLIKENQSDSFEVRLSGTPYVVEMIKRYIYNDTRILVLTTLVVSAIILLVLFRSWQVLIGTFISTISAVLLSLILMQVFKIPLGILSPNLAIIILLITQSHIIFLTSNYFNIGELNTAMKKTFPASFWSMFAMFCGFLSLSMVTSKSLSEFGLGGMIGTIVAISFAYLIYPVTLSYVLPKTTPNKVTVTDSKPRYLSSLIITGLCLFLSLGIMSLNTDPSIINHFIKGNEVRKAMLALDKNGGSSTLRLILSHPRFGSLDNDAAFNAMYALHTKLANHKDVGAVVSLPLLMKESKRTRWITKFLSWNKMLDILSGDSHQNVASRFMTRDRRHALFILRMKESGHNKPKAEIIKSIEEIVNKYGFKIDRKGGPYALQSRLATLVKSSLYHSLFWLLISFSIIALLVSRNMLTTYAMILSLALIGLATLGSFCFTGAALDVISSPAVIVSLLLAIDIMIHVVIAIKQNYQDRIFKPVLAIIFITGIGFSSLCFSQFTPMQSFGLIMVIGMVFTGFITMIVMPTILSVFCNDSQAHS